MKKSPCRLYQICQVNVKFMWKVCVHFRGSCALESIMTMITFEPIMKLKTIKKTLGVGLMILWLMWKAGMKISPSPSKPGANTLHNDDSVNDD